MMKKTLKCTNFGFFLLLKNIKVVVKNRANSIVSSVFYYLYNVQIKRNVP